MPLSDGDENQQSLSKKPTDPGHGPSSNYITTGTSVTNSVQVSPTLNSLTLRLKNPLSINVKLYHLASNFSQVEYYFGFKISFHIPLLVF